MNNILLKTIFCLVIMIVFLLMAFATKDAENGQLFALAGIITGSYLFKFLLNQNTNTDETY
jgi:uncharacterized BrkB/YihY/UPF0761 family membrane protein